MLTDLVPFLGINFNDLLELPIQFLFNMLSLKIIKSELQKDTTKYWQKNN